MDRHPRPPPSLFLSGGVRRPTGERPEPTDEPFVERDVGGPTVIKQVFDVVVDLELGDLLELEGDKRGFEGGGREGAHEEGPQRRGEPVLGGVPPKQLTPGLLMTWWTLVA